jgi:protein dithiol oxidoreductase (disulfide-forming)
MRFLRQAGAAVGLSLYVLAASASPADPKYGVDYLTLPESQHTDAAGKVEVVEFFSYACPHCNAFEPSLSEWVKKQNGSKVAFRRVPLAFHAQWVPLQKMYYALEALGRVDEMHAKVFYAVHRDRMPFATDNAVIDIAAKLGLDRQKFTDVYNSFTVQSKVRRAAELQEAYKAPHVPLLAVAGKYETSPGILSENGLTQPEDQLFSSALQVADFLIANAGKK